MSSKEVTKDQLSPEKYLDPFLKETVSEELKLSLALERAWKNRDFEIDKYWSRATYFWAFIAATFAGYIAVAGSKSLTPQFREDLAFVVICMGFIFSTSWYLVNIGSKKWQENWEKHIDALEDRVTGPIYKTVLDKKGYSVSRINILVSLFVTTVWLLLGVSHVTNTILKGYGRTSLNINIIVAVVLTLTFTVLLLRTKTSSTTKPFYFTRRVSGYEEQASKLNAEKSDEKNSPANS